MMTSEQSEKARERHADAYITMLRDKLGDDLPGFNETVIQVISDMYRNGWNDAYAMFRLMEEAE